ncbi:MAG: peptide/nickel transport system permease protein [Candidatus Azotimanducaceae bacterium]|jgi:peptide/nickel transport system permease protein
MLRFILQRLLALIPLLLGVSLVVFSLVLLIPGDPAYMLAGEDASPETVAKIREELGLNQPVLVRYGEWLVALLQGDLGTSLFSEQPVADVILQRLPVTLSLAFTAIVIALAISIPAGIIAGIRPGKLADRVVTTGSSIGLAVPNFWLGLMLVLLLAIRNPWFPATGYVPLSESLLGWWSHMVLPAFTLGLAAAAILTRQLRGAMVDVMQQDFIRTARAKGLLSWKVVVKHGFKNAAIPMVTILGVQANGLLGGTIIVEQVFGMTGIGQLAVASVFTRDLPMIQGVVIMSVFVAVLVNLLVDVSYGYFNPKVRPQ